MLFLHKKKTLRNEQLIPGYYQTQGLMCHCMNNGAFKTSGVDGDHGVHRNEDCSDHMANREKYPLPVVVNKVNL